jgi:hypothetical protein
MLTAAHSNPSLPQQPTDNTQPTPMVSQQLPGDIETYKLPQGIESQWRINSLAERAQDWTTAAEDKMWDRLQQKAKEPAEVFAFLNESVQPASHNTLTIPTGWRNSNGATVTIAALLDTGCNTSAVTTSFIKRILDDNKQPILPTILEKPVTLVSATGHLISSDKACNLDFTIGGVEIKHAFYIFDTLPYDIILGMDFARAKRLILNMGDETLTSQTLPINLQIRHHTCKPIHLNSLRTITIQPGQTSQVQLKPSAHLHPPGETLTGYVEPAIKTEYEEGVIVWKGMMEMQDNMINIWISNFTTEQVTLDENETMAMWTTTNPSELTLANNLANRPASMSTKVHVARCMSLHQEQHEHNALHQEQQHSAEDWEWQDGHMSIDVSGIPLPEPDPPMDATLQQLRECRAQTADKLSAAAQPDSKMETEEVGTIASQFKRVNDRILQHEATSSGDKQLPEQLLFTTSTNTCQKNKSTISRKS